MSTLRLTVAQALVRFLSCQYSERDGAGSRLVEGCFGIFGHGNVAGLGQALLEAERETPGAFVFRPVRNEQASVHAAAAFARMRNRLSTMACTSSIGPGATNMVTGAALASVNRLPVLLLPGDVFATRPADPVLQQLEHPLYRDVSVNDAFRPVSAFFDRVARPEQLPEALLGAMQALTDQARTGAVTVCLDQDVQAEAYDWPVELFSKRVWHLERPPADPRAVWRALQALRAARRPLIVAGGGVVYSEATAQLGAFAEAAGAPVAETQAGKGSLAYDHPLSVGAVGVTGTAAANALAREADVVVGIGTRWADFTTASRTAFGNPDVVFVNVNIARADATKHAGVSLVGDARAVLDQLVAGLGGWSAEAAYREEARALARAWDATVERAYHLGNGPLPAQCEVIGAVNEASGPSDVVVCAAGSMPGDLHKLWRARDPKGYHVEYGYSCMGYEIAGGLGVKLAAPEREVYVLVGDGSYLMMAQELQTAVQEGVKLIVVVVDNHGFASIGSLSETVGTERFATSYRSRDQVSGRLEGAVLPVDFVANARSLGAKAVGVKTIAQLRSALADAKSAEGPVVVCVETDPLVPAPSSESWWDVAVAEVAKAEPVVSARKGYEVAKARQLAARGRY
ncbi:MAG: 3D-(3,5/4)-trihydroxycyclohexane-1,2-dione acylhydrolase (decyclizing), partial [Actinobacteria bacterium]|nr:3D-(3,5/4)-trihydroxycyclohexane-1,2-dione acylhydrolase (decyclizing) [Actinomycetota bacterium]